jgi:hypothetical protein
MLTQFISVVILAGAALFFNNGWLIPRVDLPAHLLGHPALFKKEFISEATRVELLELVKSFKSLPTNVEDLKYYKTLHEHIGEAVPFSGSCPHPLLVPNINRTLCTFPGRVDIGSHYIRSGGHEGLKETYESLVSRVLSFGVYLFDLSKVSDDFFFFFFVFFFFLFLRSILLLLLFSTVQTFKKAVVLFVLLDARIWIHSSSISL